MTSSQIANVNPRFIGFGSSQALSGRQAYLERANASSQYSQPFGDTQALGLWLSIFDLKSPSTARHYRTQTAKFRLFLQLLHPDWASNTHIQQASEEDVALYEHALGLKELPNGSAPNLLLSGTELTQLGIVDQPFAKALKESSINQALSVLNALYEYLRTPNGVMVTPYVVVNPVKRVRKRINRSVAQTDRSIPIEGIQAMNTYMHTVIARAESIGDKVTAANYERKLWIFTLLFGLWGRREELSKLSMKDFKQKSSKEWEVSLLRKGGKREDQPVANWVIAGLRRYRKSVGLLSNWALDDPLPSILGIRTRMGRAGAKHVSPQVLYLEIVALAKETAHEISSGNLLPAVDHEERVFLSEKLGRCSPHWFRHSGPTISINDGSISLQLASKILGHSSVATTSQMYFHADKNKMRQGLDALGSKLAE
jgi:integrase